ncbi:MAG: hypothetical protein HRT47_09665 [Candidatus Caenarcaniphilales bacterium]|nr:hypothetical protein [Candidatus Caenarcaniphilales bacterium]
MQEISADSPNNKSSLTASDKNKLTQNTLESKSNSLGTNNRVNNISLNEANQTFSFEVQVPGSKGGGILKYQFPISENANLKVLYYENILNNLSNSVEVEYRTKNISQKGTFPLQELSNHQTIVSLTKTALANAILEKGRTKNNDSLDSKSLVNNSIPIFVNYVDSTEDLVETTRLAANETLVSILKDQSEQLIQAEGFTDIIYQLIDRAEADKDLSIELGTLLESGTELAPGVVIREDIKLVLNNDRKNTNEISFSTNNIMINMDSYDTSLVYPAVDFKVSFEPPLSKKIGGLIKRDLFSLLGKNNQVFIDLINDAEIPERGADLNNLTRDLQGDIPSIKNQVIDPDTLIIGLKRATVSVDKEQTRLLKVNYYLDVLHKGEEKKVKLSFNIPAGAK